MNKVNRRLILSLTIIMVISVLVGCSKMPDGVENKAFVKDLDKLLYDVSESTSTRIYRDDEIADILDKMNTPTYTVNLNDYEILILNTITDTAPDIKKDLQSKNRAITWENHEKIEWIYQIFDDYKTK